MTKHTVQSVSVETHTHTVHRLYLRFLSNRLYCVLIYDSIIFYYSSIVI